MMRPQPEVTRAIMFVGRRSKVQAGHRRVITHVQISTSSHRQQRTDAATILSARGCAMPSLLVRHHPMHTWLWHHSSSDEVGGSAAVRTAAARRPLHSPPRTSGALNNAQGDSGLRPQNGKQGSGARKSTSTSNLKNPHTYSEAVQEPSAPRTEFTPVQCT